MNRSTRNALTSPVSATAGPSHPPPTICSHHFESSPLVVVRRRVQARAHRDRSQRDCQLYDVRVVPCRVRVTRCGIRVVRCRVAFVWSTLNVAIRVLCLTTCCVRPRPCAGRLTYWQLILPMRHVRARRSRFRVALWAVRLRTWNVRVVTWNVCLFCRRRAARPWSGSARATPRRDRTSRSDH